MIASGGHWWVAYCIVTGRENGKFRFIVGLEIDSEEEVHMCNPWPGEDIEIIDARISSVILRATSAAILEFFARAARYLVRRATEAIKPLPFGALSRARVTDPKCIGSRTIELVN
jgi:alpha-L-fucosidase 2